MMVSGGLHDPFFAEFVLDDDLLEPLQVGLRGHFECRGPDAAGYLVVLPGDYRAGFLGLGVDAVLIDAAELMDKGHAYPGAFHLDGDLSFPRNKSIDICHGHVPGTGLKLP